MLQAGLRYMYDIDRMKFPPSGDRRSDGERWWYGIPTTNFKDAVENVEKGG